MAKEVKQEAKKESELTIIDKAAIVLYSLGEDAASEILKLMDHDDVREISKSMTQMTSISSQVVDDTIDEFYNMVSNDEIIYTLENNPIDKAVGALIQKALDSGADDNVSVILVQGEPGESSS